jgi:hypothetical protein
VIGLGIPESAGITGGLLGAGLTAGEVHRWYGTPRRELPLLMSPRDYLELQPKGGGRVLALARRDVVDTNALGELVGRANHDQRGA